MDQTPQQGMEFESQDHNGVRCMKNRAQSWGGRSSETCSSPPPLGGQDPQVPSTAGTEQVNKQGIHQNTGFHVPQQAEVLLLCLPEALPTGWG